MPLHLLRDIPREIRDQIYAHALSSPYGCVSLEPSKDRHWGDGARVDIVPTNPRTYERVTSEPVIRLNLLRTCSQIHLEARNILWKHNSLAIAQASTLYLHSRFLDPRFSYAVESIQMKMDIMASPGALTNMAGTYKIFGNWAQKGNLRSFTLTMLLGAHRGMSALDNLVELWSPLQRLQHVRPTTDPSETLLKTLEKLKEAEEVLPAQLKRRIVFETDWDILPLIAKRNWMKLREKLHPQDVIKTIHDAFGGEFWMDGKLCYKDHVEIERVFDISLDDKIWTQKQSDSHFEPRSDLMDAVDSES